MDLLSSPSEVEMPMRKWRALGWLLGSFWFMPVARAADIGQLTAICRDCHGENGLSQSSDIPIIAGQTYTVIEDNLLAFRAGERPCTETRYRHGDTSRAPTSMCSIAGGLSDDDIAALAEHFESLDYVPAQQDFDPLRVEAGAAAHAKGNCGVCHADGGRQTNGLACRLAGQWMPYLAKAFGEIRAGERFGPVVMNEAIQSFTEEEIDALLHFYASQQD
jgi:sulfide dehydrogenase cytochrome subunit